MQVYAEAAVAKLLRDFEEEAERTMLFLKSVQSLEIYSWSAEAHQSVLTFSCNIENMTTSLRASRSLFGSQVICARSCLAPSESFSK